MHSEPLQDLGIHCFEWPLNDSRFDTWIAREAPDYVVFDRFVREEQFGWKAREASPGSVRVVDAQDLHFLRHARENLVTGGINDQVSPHDPLTGASLLSDEFYREMASFARSDLVWVLSSYERDLLNHLSGLPNNHVKLSRFSYTEPPEPQIMQNRKGFAFIGNFRHPPNLDAIFWLKNKIWPQIQALLPNAEIKVMGAYPSREVMALNDPSLGFRITGPVADSLEALSQSRVNLAPLRFGAGIKGKITDGFWAGTPAIATSIAAEGISETLVFGGMIENDTNAFAQAAVSLHEDEAFWLSAQKRGLEIIHTEYLEKPNRARIIADLTFAKSRLHERRNLNWFGETLWREERQAKKYLSKWIEAKALKREPDTTTEKQASHIDCNG